MLNKTINNLKSLSQFAAAGMVGAGVCLGAYIAAVDYLIPRGKMPSTYKSFLMSEVPGPRLIIDSGSNSHHALDAEMLSKELNLTAVNVADNAGYDIENKVARLHQFAKPGDTVLLPLEWSYYTTDSLTDDYVRTLFGAGKDYYRGLGLMDRARLALSLPPREILGRLFGDIKPVKSRDELSLSQRIFLTALRYPHGSHSNETAGAALPGVDTQSCDQYVFGKAIKAGKLEVSSKFKRAVSQLATLKARNVRVLFAWPVLVGDGCLTSNPDIIRFRDEVESTVEAAGFSFLGTTSSNLYPLSLRDDSPYHLIQKGTKQHTQKMVGFLKAVGVAGAGKGLNLRKLATERVYELERAEITQAPIFPLAVNHKYEIGTNSGQSNVIFAAGWWPEDPHGRLMRDNKAIIGLSLPKDVPDDAHIEIYGISTSEPQHTVTVLNRGQLLAESGFTRETPIVVPVKNLERETPVWLHLDLPDAGPSTSPKERGENQDERTVTLRVMHVKLAVGDGVETAPIQPAPSPAPAQKAPAPQTEMPAENVLHTASTKITSHLAAPLNSPLPVGHKKVGHFVRFGEGWWEPEPAGRWMKGRRAELSLILPDGPRTASSLHIHGDLFQGNPQPIEVFYDGKLIKRSILQLGVPVDIPLDALPRATSLVFIINLPDAQLKSPKDLGLSPDTRVLTAFVTSIELKSTEN